MRWSAAPTCYLWPTYPLPARSFLINCPQANRWWLHLYRLLTGEWSEDLKSSNPLQLQSESAEAAGTTATPTAPSGKVFKSPDWPSARCCFPDWLWSGLVSDDPKTATGAAEAPAGLDAASLDHARGELPVLLARLVEA